MGLKIKIFTGYGILIALLAFTVYLFRKEQVKRNALQKNKKELACFHKLSKRSYASLLELATQAETVSVWDEEDIRLYHDKRVETCNTLQALKDYSLIPEQQARIDSLCILLEEKENLLGDVMSAFHRLQDFSGIVSRKIPSIVSKVRNISQDTAGRSSAPRPAETSEKKRSFWSFLKRKEQKSAYLQQRERQEAGRENPGAPSPAATTTRMLHSLNREVEEQQQIQRENLLAQMENLYRNNTILNRKLNSLAGDFEKETNERLSLRYRQFMAERDRSYYAVSGLATLVSLLALVLYAIVHRDLNKKYRYEQELETSSRTNKALLQSKKEMILSIAHDLRAPLTTISGCAELLPQETDRARQNEYAENILHSSGYMLGLVNTLMEFYLLNTGQIKNNNSIFHPEALFKETIRNFEPLAKKKGLQLSACFQGLDTVVCGDKGHLQQIVNNLLSNALKFTRQGSVRLEAEYADGELRFLVEDTGAGMTEEEADRIFNEFERLDNARGVSGFGLGLAISSKLAARMGGTIRVKSSPGEGSRFSVFLPFPPASSGTPLEGKWSLTDYGLEGVRILLIDDDRIQQGITKEMLARNRIQCDCCTHSWELVPQLREKDYDLLLTDIQMPDTDGFGILELLRSSNIEKARSIPVIAVTARMDDEEAYLSGGFAGCLYKPYSMDQLMRAVAKAAGSGKGKAWHPDFSLLLAGEDDRREMLSLFISEARKDISILDGALRQEDWETVSSLLHKRLPLWETVRLNYPLGLLRELATSDLSSWTDRQKVQIREITVAVRQLVDHAEKIRIGQ